jgi:hypothetical protein
MRPCDCLRRKYVRDSIGAHRLPHIIMQSTDNIIRTWHYIFSEITMAAQ